MSTPLVVDCDPGLDDALALTLLAAARIEIALVTTVAGNASLNVVTANACAIVDRLALSCPVAAGASGRHEGDARLATALWGGDGRLDLPTASRKALTSAADAFAETTGRVSILAVGPMTNVAAFLAAHPCKVTSIAAMGGALGRGNATPEAEMNIWADPVAAAAVFGSGTPVTLAPLDLTRELHLPENLVSRLDIRRPRAALAARLFARLGQPHEPATPHDLAAAGWLLWPDLFETRRGRIDVITQSGAAEGRTLFVDDPSGPHQVLTGVDRERFWTAVAETLNRGGPFGHSIAARRAIG